MIGLGGDQLMEDMVSKGLVLASLFHQNHKALCSSILLKVQYCIINGLVPILQKCMRNQIRNRLALGLTCVDSLEDNCMVGLVVSC